MIHKLKYGDQELPLKIGYGAVLKMQEETGADMNEMEKGKMGLRESEALFFFCLKAGHVATDKPFDISREKSATIWEDNLVEFSQMMVKSFDEVAKKDEPLSKKN
jgi:hypothetical protein